MMTLAAATSGSSLGCLAARSDMAVAVLTLLVQRRVLGCLTQVLQVTASTL